MLRAIFAPVPLRLPLADIAALAAVMPLLTEARRPPLQGLAYAFRLDPVEAWPMRCPPTSSPATHEAQSTI